MSALDADEDFSFPVVEHLRRLGHDVLTAQESGQAGQGVSDSQVLAFAGARNRAVVTFNRRHFIKLHQQGTVHSGIIACTRDRDVAALAQRIDQAISGLPSLDNRLVRIQRPPSP